MFREQSLFFAGGGGEESGEWKILGDQMVFQGDKGGSVVANRV